MRRRYRLLAAALFAPPLLILAGAIGYASWAARHATDGLVPPTALGWRLDGDAVDVIVGHQVDGELEHFAFDFHGAGRLLHRTNFLIDHDLFGGGFAGGLDLDDDGRLELVLATRAGPRASRVIDIHDGLIRERPFVALPEARWRAVAARLALVGVPPVAALGAGAAVLWFALGVMAVAILLAWRLVRALLPAR
ncbi:MAG: hypothetical protein AB7Q81_10285 [Gammaproteobacteria bacterium]